MGRIAEYSPETGTVYRDMTTDEVEAMESELESMPDAEPTPEERIAYLEQQNEMLMECLLEMSEVVYA